MQIFQHRLNSFLEFIPTALNIAFILSPGMPFNLFLSKQCPCFKSHMPESIIARPRVKTLKTNF